jgi:hypothetical protein
MIFQHKRFVVCSLAVVAAAFAISTASAQTLTIGVRGGIAQTYFRYVDVVGRWVGSGATVG